MSELDTNEVRRCLAEMRANQVATEQKDKLERSPEYRAERLAERMQGMPPDVINLFIARRLVDLEDRISDLNRRTFMHQSIG